MSRSTADLELLARLERRLAGLTDAELLLEYDVSEPDSPEAELYLGEMERRDLEE